VFNCFFGLSPYLTENTAYYINRNAFWRHGWHGNQCVT
jgi:hypothetical protein